MGISCNNALLEVGPKFRADSLSANQSRSRDFLNISQKSVDVLDVVSIPVRATSGAISFITGTYHNRVSC